LTAINEDRIIHVDGYGAFDNYSIDGLHPGLSIVFGHNEAGKSTLLDFVRGVLFGFADGRSPAVSIARYAVGGTADVLA